jgi:acetolactate synthase-1/2/3 large subunit
MKLSTYVIDQLAEQGITHIFEVCGGALAHLLDSLYDRTDITTVSMHHEMAAAIAAEGYARASGNFGVAMATSGPGATNLITGIGSCYFDSIPCLFITGQVNTYEYKGNTQVRQIGFQETDIVSIVKPITKLAVMVDHEEEIRYLLETSLEIMKSGRKGPVLIDLPLNIQRAEIKPKTLKGGNNYSDSEPWIGPNFISKVYNVMDLVNTCKRPVILVGGGVRSAGAVNQLSVFAHKTEIPVVSTLMGLDSFPHDDPLYAGMIGTYGNRSANLTVANSDLVIALGTRFDTRQTGTQPKTFARAAKIVHVDIDPRELGTKIKPDIAIQANVLDFLYAINDCVVSNDNEKWNAYRIWKRKIDQYKEKYIDFVPPEISGKKEIDPNWFFNQLSGVLPENAIVCVDVGQIQMWAAQSLCLTKGQRFLTEGGMASIGSAVPLAIGAAFAKPGTPIVAIVGDGGFQLNIQELQTIFHHQLPIKIIMLNNNGYGMIKQFQEQYMNSRFQSSGVGYSNPNFQAVVNAYNIFAMKISKNNQIMPFLKRVMSEDGPVFLEVVIDEKARVCPKLSVNRPIEDQEPLLSRAELKKDMLIDMLPEPDTK